MNTAIIPEIKQMKTYSAPLRLTDYHLSAEVTEHFPRAEEIFSENGPLNGEMPICYTEQPMAEEAYRICARSSRIDITASSEKGLMYALFTLSELDFANDGELCEFDACDEPSLALRALSDDISRGQISTFDHFCTMIRRLARYKYNTYMPYMEDVFRFESIPAWGRYSDPMSAQEWKALIAYAAEWQISVRPIINLLGHFDKLLYIEELQPLALKKEDGSLISCMDPTNPEVHEVIRKMLREIVSCFGPGVIHCGGDEPVGLTEVFGEERGGELFIEHYRFVHEELAALGCTMMMYADFFAPPWGDYAVPVTRAKELPGDTEFVFWDYGARDAYPFVDALHEQNIRMYISPGSWTWKRFSCDIRQCFENTKGLLKADGGRSRGMIMSSWADGGDTLRDLMLPGVLIGANFCWSPSSGYDLEKIYNVIHKSLYGFDAQQAALLEPIYHHDRILERANEHEFKLEMFRTPFEPVAFGAREHIDILRTALQKAQEDYQSLVPRRNKQAYDALSLTLARAEFTAEKIALLPWKRLQSIEEGQKYASRALLLCGELRKVKALHEKLWHETSRESEWQICACRYDDLCDELSMFARNAALRRYYERDCEI